MVEVKSSNLFGPIFSIISFISKGCVNLGMAKKRDDYSKYFFIYFTIFMVVLVFLVIKPFIPALLSSLLLAYIFYPLFKWFKKYLRNKYVSSFIVTVIIIILLILPLFFVLNTLTREAYVNYLISKQKLLTLGSAFKETNPNMPFYATISYLGNFLDDPKVKYHLEDSMEKVSTYVLNSASDLVLSIPRFILNFFIMLFTIFFLFIDGPVIIQRLRKVLPLGDVYKRHLFEKFGKTTHAIVYGYIVVAMIQGALGGIGFYLFGFPSPVIWGIVMALTSLIPFMGAAIVWFPAGFFKLIGGISANNNSEIAIACYFLIYSAIIVSSLDNVLRAKIIGDKAKVHPVLIMVGVFGGLYLIGSVGAIIGPLVLSLFVTFIEAYMTEKNEA